MQYEVASGVCRHQRMKLDPVLAGCLFFEVLVGG